MFNEPQQFLKEPDISNEVSRNVTGLENSSQMTNPTLHEEKVE